MMLRYTLSILLMIACTDLVQAQTDSLIHSGYHLERAKILLDSGLYEQAIRQFQYIDSRDTNYVNSLTELSNAYFSNKQYEEAIATTFMALLQPSSFRCQLLTTQGMAYVEIGQYEKARAVFEMGMKEFPFYPSFPNQYGKMLYIQKQYAEAEKYFFQALTTSPFNLTSHLYLAFISMHRGEKTRGMMAMGTYMALNNSANNHLITLERFVKSELTDEFSVPSSADNPFARLDEIIRSEIAMDDRYKTKIPLNIGIVKQYQLLFDQLATQEFTSNDPWVSIYVPIYKSLIKANQQEAFVYHILKSTSIKLVPEWLNKNEKTLQNFYSVMNTAIPLVREKKALPESWGYREPVSCWYTSNNRLESIGQKDSKNETIGLWYFFNDNGSIKARGTFDEHGKKIGLWKYYHESGIQSDIENFDTGERIHFDEQGSVSQKYWVKNGKIDGELLNYFSCGNVRERIQFRNGLREGYGEVYSIQGTAIEKFTYLNDSLHGAYRAYFETGKLKQESTYDRGMLNKTFTRYYQNGKIASQGEYVMNNATGLWKNYHDNGKVKEEGHYKDDLPVGKFTFYDRKGIVIETRNYNDKGQYHGENLFMHNGKLHYRLNYRDDLIIEITYYNQSGNVIAAYADNNGNFKSKGYYATGELRSEYQYTEGKATGLWKYYYRTGSLESVYEYDRVLNGKAIDYYPDNSVKAISYYKEGRLHGRYEEFTESGQPQVKGWYQHGMLQQRWNVYYPNGKIKVDRYHLNDMLTGSYYYYDPEGKIISTTIYKDGKVANIENYNEKGELNSVTTAPDNSGRLTILTQFKSGVKALQTELLCGELHGNAVISLPDGKPYIIRQFANDQLNGNYERYYLNGTLESSGKYCDDSALSFTWYYPNKTIETQGTYADDERDSLWTYYHENGKISFLTEYQNSKKHGIAKIFSLDGQLILEKLYDEGDLISYRTAGIQDTTWKSFTGTGTIRAHYPGGKLAFEESYSNGQLDGLSKIYYTNGILFSQSNYINGQSEGISLENFQSGKPRFKKNYKWGELNGRSEYYNADGLLERVENYFYGLLQGPTEFFSNGRKVREVRFWYGLPTD